VLVPTSRPGRDTNGRSADSDTGASAALPDGSAGELLDAVTAIAGKLELSAVLDLIVRSACSLTGAQFGALGVLGRPNDQPGLGLAEFHQRGIDESTIRDMGRGPHGDGVLGVLIDDPRPLRLAEITDHPASVGFPEYHPAMHTFLGVPVHVGDTVFGNLYLCDKPAGAGFTDEDQRVVVGLAAAAGVAIDNARLFAESRNRQRWLAAAARSSSELGADPKRGPELIAAHALEASGSSQVWLSLPAPVADQEDLVRPATTDAFVVNGVAGDSAQAQLHSVVRIETDDDGKLHLADAAAPEATVIGFRVRGRLIGVMVLIPDSGWSEDEIDSVTAFADHVALASEHVRTEHNRNRLAVYTDRDRIARDLHDQVIQRIFATGLGLQSVLRRISDEDTRERLTRLVDDLDDTIVQIRSTIFSLQHDEADDERGLRDDIVGIVADAARVLGFEPTLTLVGPIDSAVPAAMTEDVLATLRESLSNVVRHAQAGTVDVLVAVDDRAHTLSVQVTDDGIGIPSHARTGSGLRNTAARARAAGGHASVARRASVGTTFSWIVPLPV
jgi:signal transduction histidine kinase